MRVALSSSPSPELPELDFFNTWKIAGGAELLLDIVLVREIVTKSSLGGKGGNVVQWQQQVLSLKIKKVLNVARGGICY